MSVSAPTTSWDYSSIFDCWILACSKNPEKSEIWILQSYSRSRGLSGQKLQHLANKVCTQTFCKKSKKSEFRCEICNKGFTNKQYMSRHVASIHEKVWRLQVKNINCSYSSRNKVNFNTFPKFSNYYRNKTCKFGYGNLSSYRSF